MHTSTHAHGEASAGMTAQPQPPSGPGKRQTAAAAAAAAAAAGAAASGRGQPSSPSKPSMHHRDKQTAPPPPTAERQQCSHAARSLSFSFDQAAPHTPWAAATPRAGRRGLRARGYAGGGDLPSYWSPAHGRTRIRQPPNTARLHSPPQRLKTVNVRSNERHNYVGERLHGLPHCHHGLACSCRLCVAWLAMAPHHDLR